MAVTSSGVVRNVTIVALMSAVSLNSSADRCWVLPGAIAPKLSLPGLVFAAAMMSGMVLYGPAAWVAIVRSSQAITEIGVKSRNTS